MYPSSIYPDNVHRIEMEIDNWARFIGLNDYLRPLFKSILGDVRFYWIPDLNRYRLCFLIEANTYNDTCVAIRTTIGDYLNKGELKIP
jgi:hypothetical protein